MDNSDKSLTKNLTSSTELYSLVSKSIAEVICFSTNENMKHSCLKLLNINNSLEAEKVINQQLIEWKKQPIENRYLKSEVGLPAQKRKMDNELNKMITNDLENWE